MTDRSTYFKLPTEPFLLVLLKRVLCSRCGLSSDKLPTKNGKNELKLFLGGLFYITFCHFNKPRTAPIAKTPMTIFLGVNMLLGAVLLVELLFGCPPPNIPSVVPLNVFSVLLMLVVIGVVSETLVRIEKGTVRFCSVIAETWASQPSPLSLKNIFCTSITSPLLKWYNTDFKGIPALLNCVVTVKSANVLNRYFPVDGFCVTINKFKSFYKNTQNFFIFYIFEKTDRALAKSFNSFLLPLEFIRSRNGAMEHNVNNNLSLGI